MSLVLTPPRTSDNIMWEMIEGYLCYQTVFVAHDLKLFATLAEHPLTLSEICANLNLESRAADAMLVVCASLGLIRQENGYYALTPVAEDYLVASSPTYFGGVIDFAMIQNRTVNSFESVKQAVLTNQPQVYGGEQVFKTHEEHMQLARMFTQYMHAQTIAASLTWHNQLDLSQHRIMLDIGGGSGAHAIGAVQQWTTLQAIVLDIPPVCMVAEEYIASAGLQARIRTHASDMWVAPFPAADLHFYGSIYHDWSLEKCRQLTQKSFDSLEPGGRIIIHEMLLNDDKSGPMVAAGVYMTMLLCTEGQQLSGAEISSLLSEAGFIEIEVKPTFGYWSIVTARKPK